MRRTAALTLVAVLALVGFVVFRGSRDATPAPRIARVPTPGAERAVVPAFTVPAPKRLAASPETRWAAVIEPAIARSVPGGRRVARLSTRTPEATANLVTITGRLRRYERTAWVQVRLPVLPNGTTGWVPRRALGGYHTVDTRLEVDRRRLTAELFKGGRRIFSTRIGIGQAQWPTPSGRYYVRVKLTRFASPMYGPLAFGLSARSAVLTDWPAGGYIGIHGTDQPELIPGRISHGCIRMANAAILALGRLMPVGTPVIIA